jgi:tRNA A-37 threonylcarbamoyl transferase component Bud32/tetratricopeptide (TPR) repeat protein
METVPAPNAVIAGRYVIERELGRGGMATVFLAKDLQHDARVAIKVLHPELAPLFANERFAREIRITAGLQHPNVVPILDSGNTDGLPFYTMPYVEGESLAARLHREHQLPVSEALRIATDVAGALAYAHDRGFIHRDIQPHNILLSSGHAVLADFGIARAMDVTGGERITESGVALGTAMYMSPEQGTGRNVDGRSDIYALGCVLYEMLAGSPPFTGPTPQAVLARHAVDAVPPITTVRQTVGPALEGVLARSLAKVPADRYASAHELEAALAAAAAEQTAMPATGPVRPVTATSIRARARTPLIAAGVAVLAVAAVFAWQSLRPGTRPLDPNRVAVFPLTVRQGFPGPQSLGEDIATVIGNALDGTRALKWVDGWRLAAVAKGGTPDVNINPAEMRRLARAHGCGAYVTGTLMPIGKDSVAISLQVLETSTDSTLATGRGTGSTTDAWRLGVRAINQVLPGLIPGVAERDLVSGWIDRKPEVVAAFLLGESAFRRARSEEALAHYRDAVRGDSTFVIAAIRGAQAAVWQHNGSEAESLIRLANSQPVPARYAHFVKGYASYIEGRVDSASAEFTKAVQTDPDMAVAWMQLGETYTHLLPVTGEPTVIADSAFAEAIRLDSSASHMLLHPIESRLRRGLAADAEPMIRRFLAAEPDSTLAGQIRVMQACVTRGPDRVDWKAAIAARAPAVLFAGQSLAVAGSQLPCAAAAYTAIRTYETPEMAAKDPVMDTRRWTALAGLTGILIAQGRAAEAAAHVDSAIARGEGGHSLMLVGGTLAPELEAGAARGKESYEKQWGPNCERCTSSDRVWQLGVWAAFKRDTAALDALAAALAARANATPGAGLTLMADGTAARALLVRGDTAGAIAALTRILATPVPSGSSLGWRDQEARGAERLALARALLARREFERAIQVANVFDSPANQGYVAYLPASLTVRAAAADSISDGARRAAFRSRLAALRRTDNHSARE